MARASGSDELFLLIKSLTPNEKGYFKKYAQRHVTRKSNYLQLFTALDKMEVYDEPALKRRFKNLAVEKVYLFDMILNSLMVSDEGDTVAIAIYRDLIKVHLLIKKGLTQRAVKLIDKSLAIAEQHFLFTTTATLLKLRYNVTRPTTPVSQRLAEVQLVSKAIQHQYMLQVQEDEVHWQQHIILALQHAEQHQLPVEKNTKLLNKKMLLGEVNTKQPISTQLKHMEALRFYYEWMDVKPEKKIQLAKKIEQLCKRMWEQSKNSESLLHYLRSINNLINVLFHNDLIAEAEEYVERILLLAPNSHMSIRQEVLTTYTDQKQAVMWCKGEHTEALKFTNEKLRQLKIQEKFPFQWSRVMYVVYRKVLLEISTGEYGKAVRTLQFFFGTEQKKLSPSALLAAELLYLLCQFEMGNYDTMSKAARSVVKRYPKLDAKQLKFIQAFAKARTTPQEVIDHLNMHCNDLVLFRLFILSEWLQHKNKNKPWADVVKGLFT